MRQLYPIAFWILCFPVVGQIAIAADPPQVKLPPAVEMNADEAKFSELLSGATLEGVFTVDGREGTPKKDRYSIAKAYKIKGGMWLIQSRIVYGENDVTVPVVVRMEWAGKTPVLSIRDLSIPLLGEEFGSCIVFDGERYAGTWSHGKVGGFMYGTISKTPADSKTPAEKSE